MLYLAVTIGLSFIQGIVGVRFPLTTAQKQALLDRHNDARNNASSGARVGMNGVVQPAATDMQLLVWDNGLEETAAATAALCDEDHTLVNTDALNQTLIRFRTNGTELLGENLAFITGSPSFNAILFLTDAWIAEGDGYNYSPVNNIQCNAQPNCLHYTQIVWANSRYVGCAVEDCTATPLVTPSGTFQTNYICQFFRAGNDASGTGLPYVSSATTPNGQCTNCDADRDNNCDTNAADEEFLCAGGLNNFFDFLGRTDVNICDNGLGVTLSTASTCGAGTVSPTTSPSSSPSNMPSVSPSSPPSSSPSVSPSSNPSTSPTRSPSSNPSTSPTSNPSLMPTSNPSGNPSVSPTLNPSQVPTMPPTNAPSTNPSLNPSQSPTVVTAAPSLSPSANPSSNPTGNPSLMPSLSPSATPTMATSQPTTSPSLMPTSNPSQNPSGSPTNSPSQSPSAVTNGPTSSPSLSPSANPSSMPSITPSANPTGVPSANPSIAPSVTPSANPSANPSVPPSANPSANPSVTPSANPSATPSGTPTAAPQQALVLPTASPTTTTTGNPTMSPVTTTTTTTTTSSVPTLSPTTERERLFALLGALVGDQAAAVIVGSDLTDAQVATLLLLLQLDVDDEIVADFLLASGIPLEQVVAISISLGLDIDLDDVASPDSPDSPDSGDSSDSSDDSS